MGKPHSKPRRIVTRVIVFLLLGAIVNVAVAWGFAARRATLSIERHQQGYFVIWGRPWQIVQEDRTGMIDVWWYDMNRSPGNPRAETAEALASFHNDQITERQRSGPPMPSGRSVELLSHKPDWGTLRDEPLPDSEYMGGDIAFGWPLVCLWMRTTCDVVGNMTANSQLHGGWRVKGPIAARGNNFVALPYWIIWPGFAIDTLFYAGLFWLTLAARFNLRRMWRRRRGLCIHCGYDLRGAPADSANCPECGAERIALNPETGR